MNFAAKTLFFVIDGPDNTGKTTIIKSLKKAFAKTGEWNVFVTKEPGQNLEDLDVRKFLLKPEEKRGTDALLDATMFALDRRIHLKKLKRWSHEQDNKKKNLILCDRYIYSTLAYQCFRDLADTRKVIALHEILEAYEAPDLTCLMTNDLEAPLLNRSKNEQNAKFFEFKDKFHTNSPATLATLFSHYKNAILTLKENDFFGAHNKVFFIEASRKPEQNIAEIAERIETHFAKYC